VARRILIKGTSGAGKSTLARQLAVRLALPRIELDALHHGPHWTAASEAELRARVTSVLDDARGWVIDGNYDNKLGTLLWDRAELIVWLDLPLLTKLLRLLWRTSRRLVLGEELWNGNRESLKEAFWGRDALFPWAVRSHFRQRKLWPRLLEQRPHVRLTTATEVGAWLSGVRATLE
jgi:adenylate kinase family enzyme